MSTLMTPFMRKHISGSNQTCKAKALSLSAEQPWDNWETMESDYRWWENTRQTKQICGSETIHHPGQFAFCHSALRTRQDRGLCEKALFSYNTEGHFKTCSYQCAFYTNNKEVLQTTKRNQLTIQFRQIFHKPCWNRLNRFQKLGMSM